MKRVLVLIGGVALAIILSKVVMEQVLGIQLEPLIAGWMARAGTGSALVMIALLGADLFLPIPSSLIMVLSGAAFGVMWGSMLSLVGSVGGEWLGFELVRRYRHRAAEKIVGDEELERLARVFDRHGMSVVVVTRALPVVMETMSVVAGLSKMSRSSFLLASLIGTAPIVVVYAYAGAVSRQTGSLVPAIVMLIAVAGLGWVIYRARFTDEWIARATHPGIFLRSVARFTPRIAAAFNWLPLVITSPSLTSAVSTRSTMSWKADASAAPDESTRRSCSAARTARTRVDSTSSRAGKRLPARLPPISSIVMTSPRATMQARFSTISSSATLPGHECSRSMRDTRSSTRAIVRFRSALNRCTKCRTSSGMSSRRSRSGGSRSVMTPRA